MSTIQDYLNQIKNAIYGKDVRQAIHDGIQQCYYDGHAGATDLEARQRLDSVEPDVSSLKTRMGTAESDIDTLDARVDQIVAPSGEAPSTAEVLDARVGGDGVTYLNLGDAIRGQFSDAKRDSCGCIVADATAKPFLDSVNYSTEPISLTYTTGKITMPNGTIVDFPSTKISQEVTLEKGELYHFSALKVAESSPFIIYDINSAVSATYKIISNFGNPQVGDFYFIASERFASIIVSTGLNRSAIIEKITINSSDSLRAVKTVFNNYSYADLPIVITTNKILDGNGTVVDYSSTTWAVSEELDISAYPVIKIKARTGYANAYYALYDSSHNCIYVETSPNGAPSDFEEVIFLPQNAKYVRISKAGSTASVYVANPLFDNASWNGKKWVVIGDSLTEENAATTKHYFDYIAEQTGVTTANYGVGGTGYANPNGSAGNFTARMASVPTDADVYTIFGSFNDYAYSIANEIPIGNPSDSGTSTICGYINGAFDALFERVPLANLGVVAPCPWVSVNDVTSGETGKTFAKNYTEALRLCCERRSIPFLDLYHCSGMRPWDADFVAETYTKDSLHGVHPDETGHAILAPKFKAFLESLLM